jgi:hypothetical protein
MNFLKELKNMQFLFVNYTAVKLGQGEHSLFKNMRIKPGMVTTCNPSIQKAKAGGTLRIASG